MKVAYTGWTWIGPRKEDHPKEFEQFLKEIANLGYRHAENFCFTVDIFDSNADTLIDLLKKYDIVLENLYLGYSGDFDKDWAMAERSVPFLKKAGVSYLNLQAACFPGPSVLPVDEELLRKYADLSNRIGKLCADSGIQACFHPHANSHVFTEEQIDLFLSMTDPELVGLCLDTAHTTIAGMDPVAAVTKYASRIKYMHLKDVDPELAKTDAPMSSFCPLGMGTVDFKGVYKALKAWGYDGVLCVEVDRPPVCNYHSAMVSRQYIRNVLGL